MKKQIHLLKIIFALVVVCISCKKPDQSPSKVDLPKHATLAATDTEPLGNLAEGQEIPLYNNAYFSYKPTGSTEVFTSSNGLANWTNSKTVTSIKLSVPYAGTLKLALKLKVAPAGNSSVIRVTVDGVSKDISISGNGFHEQQVDEFIINAAKTVVISFQGISKTGGYFADLSHIIVNGTAIKGHGTLYKVPLAGNAYFSGTLSPSIGASGVSNWTSANTTVNSYVRTGTGNLSVKIKAKVAGSGNVSVIKMTINGTSKNVTINSSSFSDIYVGDFAISTSGYQKISLKGISRTGSVYADISDITIGSDAASTDVLYVNNADYYYWGRRGPSCHLSYTYPTTQNIAYFYSEITVPVGQDPIGSYYMANGFGEGYFGIQVNSATERRVLFSVWSPYDTNNPNDLANEYKVLENRRGSGVTVQPFGNEGTGIQSIKVFNWKAGNSYKFLLKAQPDGSGKTDYTAWFYAPETGSWQLIASLKRPFTNKYLSNFHSFIENFDPSKGDLTRQAHYKNQWIRTSGGTWQKITSAKFTVDATYTANQRTDAAGGTNTSGYFLKNCGFFNDIVAPNSTFNYNNTSNAPSINFTTLP
jgi:hypothetical protein